MDNKLAAIFRRRLPALPKGPQSIKRIIKPDCDQMSNYHTVTENTVEVQGKDAIIWICNIAGCEVKLDSVEDAERHVRSTVDTPDIDTLLSMTNVKDQEEYVLNFRNWYIMYGKEKKIRKMLKKLAPRLFPAMQDRQVCFVP